MILPDSEIKSLIKDKKISIKPYVKENLNPASYDLRLGNEFLVVDHHNMDIIKLGQEINYRKIVADTITIPAHSFILGKTIEHIKLPNNVMMFVDGKSSIGRTGLFIQNAGIVNPGDETNLTLELFNANSLPIKLTAGTKICQVTFQYLSGPVEHAYHGKYKGQKKVQGYKIDKKTK